MTTAEDGYHARPMGRIPAEPGRGCARRPLRGRWPVTQDGGDPPCDKVTAIYEHQPSDGYVIVTGTAILQDDPAVVCQRWKRGYETYFPTEADRAHALFVEVAIERMELWIRGVTPEPFGTNRRCSSAKRKAGASSAPEAERQATRSYSRRTWSTILTRAVKQPECSSGSRRSSSWARRRGAEGRGLGRLAVQPRNLGSRAASRSMRS